MLPLVSIIIPTYNRSHIIGETLDSVFAQTYNNWECIVVDDRSSDYTEELMEFYCEKEKRIRFHRRPKKRIKGANACRNYGFQKSIGEFIQWFDSDDLMLPQFLSLKIGAIEDHDVDFVISKSANFRDPNRDDIISYNEDSYTFKQFDISNYNYVTQQVNWLTYDFLGKRYILEKVKFNEKLQSAQEFNYFSKLTCYTTNTFVLNDYLTLRRIHKISTQSLLNKDSNRRKKEMFLYLFETFKEIRKAGDPYAVEYLFLKTVKATMNIEVEGKYIIYLALELLARGKSKTAFWYFLYQNSYKFINKGNIFRRKFIKAFNKDFQKERYSL